MIFLTDRKFQTRDHQNIFNLILTYIYFSFFLSFFLGGGGGVVGVGVGWGALSEYSDSSTYIGGVQTSRAHTPDRRFVKKSFRFNPTLVLLFF